MLKSVGVPALFFTSPSRDRIVAVQARAGCGRSSFPRRSIATAGLIITLILAFAELFGNSDPVSLPLLNRIEASKVDDVVVGASLVLIWVVFGCFSAAAKRRRDIEISEQRLRVLKATMRTVQDIVNNSLSNLQFFRIEAEGLLSRESLAAFDRIVAETSSDLKGLGDLTSTPETKLAMGVGIDFHPSHEDHTCSH